MCLPSRSEKEITPKKFDKVLVHSNTELSLRSSLQAPAWEGPRDWGDQGSPQVPTSTARCSSRRNYCQGRTWENLNLWIVFKWRIQLKSSGLWSSLPSPQHTASLSKRNQGKNKNEKNRKATPCDLVVQGETERPCWGVGSSAVAFPWQRVPSQGAQHRRFAPSQRPAVTTCFRTTHLDECSQRHLLENIIKQGELQRPHLHEGLKYWRESACQILGTQNARPPIFLLQASAVRGTPLVSTKKCLPPCLGPLA